MEDCKRVLRMPASGLETRYRCLKWVAVICGVAGGLAGLWLADVQFADDYGPIRMHAYQASPAGSVAVLHVESFGTTIYTRHSPYLAELMGEMQMWGLGVSALYAAMGAVLGSAVPLFMVIRQARRGLPH